MTQSIVHPQRVAWEGARVFARTLDTVWCGWLADQLAARLGPAYRQKVIDSRTRLLTSRRPDAIDVEVGMWRARLDDVLRERPELAGPIADLTRTTADHLRDWVR